MITEMEYIEKVSEKFSAPSAAQGSPLGSLYSESGLLSEAGPPAEALIERLIYHEFKSPLTTIKGYLQLIQKGVFQPEEQERIKSDRLCRRCGWDIL